MKFSQWLPAVAILVVSVALIEQYDERLALALAVLSLLAVLFHNRQAFSELLSIIGNPGHAGGGSAGG